MHRAVIRSVRRALVPALGLALGLGFGLASCKTAPQVKAPGTFTVEPTGLKTTHQTLSSFTVTLSASVENPGKVPLTITGADYTLTVGGKVLRTGHAPLELTVAPTSSGQLSFPVAVEYALKLEELQKLASTPTIDLLLGGTIDGKLGTQAVQVPFSRAGQLRSPRLPTVKLGTPDAARQSLSEIAATFRLQVENDNPFPVKLDGLDYVLTVQGADVASGTVGDRTTVPPSSTQTWEVPTDLTEKTVPGMTKAMKENNALDDHLKGVLHLGPVDVPVDLTSQITFTEQR